jgi:predicted nucleotidyltransferase component of viral defense system
MAIMSTELHERAAEMRAAVEYTAAETGFALHLIEKDYWCSVLLKGLLDLNELPLVFKGGTLLSKGFAEFERLSEDLDFTIPTSGDVSRSQRRKRAAKVHDRLEALIDQYGLEWKEEWRGHNVSRQHTAKLRYPSIFRGSESILIEVSQREEPLLELKWPELGTLLQEPIHGEPVVAPFGGTALAPLEAYAEKARAALTRRDPAIRDIYDLWKGFSAGYVDPADEDWLNLVRQKCNHFDISSACKETRMEAFRRGVRTDLAPVLRIGKVDEFPLTEALELTVKIYKGVNS